MARAERFRLARAGDSFHFRGMGKTSRATRVGWISVVAVCAIGMAGAKPADVSADLAGFVGEGKSPGLAVAVVLDGKVVAVGAAGVRKFGDPAKVTVEDKFHIGSCTKSMTASLAAMLVRDGKIKWSTTVAEVFPEMEMNEGFRSATLLELCGNCGGVPGDIPPELWKRTVADRGKPESDQRLALVRALLAGEPAYVPGSRRVYSNGGFTIAGAMLEKVSGMSYQELISKRLFAPLGMKSTGFGAPDGDEPFGHVMHNGQPEPVTPGLDADNPPAITPAGRVHLSVLDFAKYANLHLAEGVKPPLDVASLVFLHTPIPPGQDYAAGWNLVPRDWADGLAHYHNGTNTMNYAVIWLAPKKVFGVVAVANIGGERGAKACDEAAALMIRRFLGK